MASSTEDEDDESHGEVVVEVARSNAGRRTEERFCKGRGGSVMARDRKEGRGDGEEDTRENDLVVFAGRDRTVEERLRG